MVELKNFLKRFLMVFLGLYLFFLLPELASPLNLPFPDFLFPVKLFVAFASMMVLQFMGSSVTLEGLTLSLSATNFTIISSCTGVVSFSIFAGLIYATPMKNKKYYLLLGLPLFVLWNVFRVTLTLSFGDDLVGILHNGFWLLSIILVMGVYLIVLNREKVYLHE